MPEVPLADVVVAVQGLKRLVLRGRERVPAELVEQQLEEAVRDGVRMQQRKHRGQPEQQRLPRLWRTHRAPCRLEDGLRDDRAKLQRHKAQKVQPRDAGVLVGRPLLLLGRRRPLLLQLLLLLR